MTNATMIQIDTELARWQSTSRIQSPAYFAASVMSDAQEALFRGLKEIALENLEAAQYLLERDGRDDWAAAVAGLIGNLDARTHSVFVTTTEDGHNVYGEESAVTAGLNQLKGKIFAGIESGLIR